MPPKGKRCLHWRCRSELYYQNVSEYCQNFKIELMDFSKAVLMWHKTLDSQSCICLLICPGVFWKEAHKGDVEQAGNVTNYPNDKSSWQIHLSLVHTLIPYPSSNDQESQEKRLVLYLQNRWKSHWNNQWMQNNCTDLFPTFSTMILHQGKKRFFCTNSRRMYRWRHNRRRWYNDLLLSWWRARGRRGRGLREGPANAGSSGGPSPWSTSGTKTAPGSRRCRSWSRGWWASARCSARCCCGPGRAGSGARPSASPSSRGWWSFRPAAARSPPCGWTRPASGAPAVRSSQRLRRDREVKGPGARATFPSSHLRPPRLSYFCY